MSVWMSVVKFLVKSLLLVYSFSPILTKVGTRVLCAQCAQNCGTDFRNFEF